MTSSLNHLGVIIDGNRRWAKEKGLMPWDGHVEGYKNVLNLAEWCLARKIPEVTVWAFSTENWKRSADEVGFLMNLIKKVLNEDAHLLKEKNVQLKIIGSKNGLSDDLIKTIEALPQIDPSNVQMTLNVAFNYGGRTEIIDAVKKMLTSNFDSQKLDVESFTKFMYEPNIRPLDFIIRTSGEQRLSGFMLWHSDYAELYFSSKMWPDFTEVDLDDALKNYYTRQRRFGGQ